MKNLMIVLWVACASIYSNAVFAEALLNGCQMNETYDASGQPAYYEVNSKDNSGKLHTVYWLKTAEPGDFPNEGAYDRTTFTVQGTEAVAACERNGLFLPTLQEFEALVNCFEHDRKKMTENGLKGLFSKFPDMSGWVWWTSTIFKDLSEYEDYPSPKPETAEPYCFNAIEKMVGFTGGHGKFSVRCVAH